MSRAPNGGCWSRGCATIALAVCLAQAHAQDVATPAAPAPLPADSKPIAIPAPSPQRVDQIEITGKKADERVSSTTAKIIVNHDEIVQYGDTSLADVFKRLPSLSVSPSGAVQMRGLGGSYLQILVNGDPAPAGFSIESLSPDLIERIEILRAPSAEYSTRSIAGTINIVLREKIDDDRIGARITASDSHNVGSTYGSATTTFSGGALSVLFPVNLTSTHFNTDPNTETLGRNALDEPDLQWNTVNRSAGDFESVTLTPRVTLQLSPHNTLTSETYFRDFNSTFQNTAATLTTLGTPPEFASDISHLRSSSDNFRNLLSWDRKFDDGSAANVKLGLSDSRRQSQTLVQGFDEADSFLLNRSTDLESEDRGISFKGKYSMPLVTNHSLVFGWDTGLVHHVDSLVQQDQPAPGILPQDLDQADRARVSRAAVFGQDEWDITSRWSTYLGLRWEGLETDVSTNDPLSVNNRSSVWSPIFQTLWKLPDQDSNQVRLALARTYRTPEIYQLVPRRSDVLNNSAVNPDMQGNPNLKPELAWGLDMAIEHTTAGNGLLSAGAFARSIQDVIAQQTILIAGQYVNTPTNLSRAQTRGLEFDAKFNTQKVMPQAPSIDLHANLTRAWSSVSDVPGPFNRLAAQTPLSANGGADYHFTTHPATVGANFTFQDFGQYRSSLSQTSSLGIIRVIDAYGLYKFSRQVQLRLSGSASTHPNNVSGIFFSDATGSLTQLTQSHYYLNTRISLEMHF